MSRWCVLLFLALWACPAWADTQSEAQLKATNYANEQVSLYNSSSCTVGNTCYQACTRVSTSSTSGAGTVVAWISQGASCSVQFVASKNFPFDGVSMCVSAAPLSATAFVGASGGGSCAGGCMYKPSSGGTDVTLGSGTSIFAGASAWTATGEACEAEDSQRPYDPSKETCIATGGSYMECVKPNGQHCVTANSKTLCYTLGETGEKMTKDGKVATYRALAPATGPTSISNQTDSTVINNTTSTINNNTYNTTTYGGSGTTGGQTSTGTSDSSGDTAGDSDDSDSDDGVGSASGKVGDLYEDKGITAASIWSEYYPQVMDTPIAQKILTFVTVQGGGSCPTFDLPASAFWSAMTIDFHCSGAMLSALEAAGYLCLAVATYIALRIALT